MRKVLPRILNVIAFLLGLLILAPWRTLAVLFYNLLGDNNFLGVFFENYEWSKLALIPAFAVLLSVIYFIHSSIDRAVHKKVTTRPLVSMSLDPIAYVGIFAAIAGGFAVLFYGGTFTFNAWDYYGLGQYIPEAVSTFLAASPALSLSFFAVLFLAQFLLVVFRGKLNKKNFFARFFTWVLYVVLAFLSTKGIFDYLSNYTGGMTFIDLLGIKEMIGIGTHGADLAEIGSKVFSLGKEFYILAGLLAGGLILYIVLGLIKMRLAKINEATDYKKANKPVEEVKEEEKEENKPVEEFVPNVQKEETSDDSLFVIPKPEEEIVTEVEERTVVKQVIYEKCDLNEIFETDFGFKNASMVKREGYTDYFVSKQKFLTLSNNHKAISFRLELDKAIRLIIQYPLIGKDKYENHKIWFKIDDISILNKETVISIIKDAYTTVVNNQ